MATGHRLHGRGQTGSRCAIVRCRKAARVRGWCLMHYQRWRSLGGLGHSCSIEGCDRGYAAQGFCKLHYMRRRRYGDPLMIPSSKREYERIPTGITSPTVLGKILGVSRQRADQLLQPEKRRARAAVTAALADGFLAKPKACARCDKRTAILAAHHWDYREELDIRWLCRPCHVIVHPHGRQPRSRNGGSP